MIRKKKDPAEPSKKLPVTIDKDTLSNGDPVFKVTTDSSNIYFLSTFSKKYVLDSLATWIINFLKVVGTNGSLKDTAFEKSKVKMHPKYGDKSHEEAWEQILSHITRAGKQFERAFPMMLADLPPQLMMEVFISTILDMEEDDIFVIEGGRIQAWNEYIKLNHYALKVHRFD